MLFRYRCGIGDLGICPDDLFFKRGAAIINFVFKFFFKLCRFIFCINFTIELEYPFFLSTLFLIMRFSKRLG